MAPRNQVMSNRRERSTRPYELAVPHGVEFLARHQARSWRQRLLNQSLAVADLPQQQKAAVAQRRDCGKRCACQPIPVGSPRARFEPELSCPAQHLGNADRRRAKTMADLLGICADAVKAQQHHQGS
jgi:hypothetical protein